MKALNEFKQELSEGKVEDAVAEFKSGELEIDDIAYEIRIGKYSKEAFLKAIKKAKVGNYDDIEYELNMED